MGAKQPGGSKWPCVDGSPLASGVLVFCLLLVGAAMCSAFDAAFTCAAGQDAFRADQVPAISSYSKCNGQNGFPNPAVSTGFVHQLLSALPNIVGAAPRLPDLYASVTTGSR
jgi:hypothetical protein